MKLERSSEPLLSHAEWLRRMAQWIGAALVLIGLSLGIGIIGYHMIGGLSWIDSILEASMILGGMGAVAPMKTDAVKLFASAYALFSGFVVLSSMAIILTPWLHRLMHHFHAPADDDDKS